MTYQASLQALADPTRRAVFERLRDGPLPVGKIARGLPVSRPAVSQHLRVLREAALVAEHRSGSRHFYQIDQGGLAELRNYLDVFWDVVLERFKSAAEDQAKKEAKK